MNLLFDFGGVIVDLDKERCIAAFEKLGFDVRPYLGTYAQAGLFSELERGQVSVPVFCERLRSLCGAPQLTDRDIVQAWEAYLTTIPEERLEMLLKLKRTHRLFLLSNTNAVHWAQAENTLFRYRGLGVGDFFEKCFLSFEMGVEKPAPEIFLRTAEGIGCPPGEILFLDDSETNCLAARAVGMQALVAPAQSGWLPYFDEAGRLVEPLPAL